LLIAIFYDILAKILHYYAIFIFQHVTVHKNTRVHFMVYNAQVESKEL